MEPIRGRRSTVLKESGRPPHEAFQKADRALYEHRGTLKKMLDRAPYEQCARIEEQIKELRAEIDRDQLRAEALKLLRETINECEEEATAGVAGPVADRASKLLQRIAGKRMGAISLSDDLAPWVSGRPRRMKRSILRSSPAANASRSTWP